MWTSELVRDRFIEAASTERFLSGLKKPLAKNYWPEFRYTTEDREGWDDMAKQDHLAIWQGRGTAKADALSRYQECLDWTVERITDPKRRQLVWAFAECRAFKRDFGKLCRERGWVKATAYNRLNRAWAQLAADLDNDNIALRLAPSTSVGHEPHPLVQISSTLGDCASPVAIKFTPGYRTEPSRHLLKDEASIADFQSKLDAVNADRRRLQEREAKRRAKIGAMAS
jgi:hypothetical protein